MWSRLALFLLAAPLFAQQLPFNQLVVFGDSLSDNGNLYAATKSFGLATPAPPKYAIGEYTDGTNSVPSTTAPLGLWIEQLAAKLNLAVPQPFLGGGSNYAVAGAVTGKAAGFQVKNPPSLTIIPGLTDQLNVFLLSNKPSATAMYVFWGGGNDILNASVSSAMTAATTAAANVQGNIDTLAAGGAKYFLWVNLPLVGDVPERINSGNSATLNAAAAAYNQAMTSGIATLTAAHPGIVIASVDSFGLFTSIEKHSALYGFTNVTAGAQGLANVNPNTYVFWDTLHPTTVGHAYVANIAYSAILAALGGPAYSCSNATAPAVTSVVSASAYGGYSYFTSGSWLEIKGTNLADPTDPRLTAAVHPGEWTTSDFSGANAPTALDGISVSINGKPAYVWYLSPGQLNVQAPEDATLGNVSITVKNCTTASAPFNLPRQALAPGLLAPPNYSSNGTQYAVATFADGTYVLNTSLGASFGVTSRPAKPGDTVIFYGVGFGDVTPAILPGVVVGQSNKLMNPVAFSFGSTPAADPLYQGLAGNFVGLYEFYVTVPAGLANGDYQIHVTQNGAELPQKFDLTVQN